MWTLVLKRFGAGIVTLLLLSAIAFVGSEVLPGNPGVAILGPDASPDAVAQLNASLGLDRPPLVRYWDWLSGFITGDFGISYSYSEPVSTLIGAAALNSAKLAAVAVIVTLPLSIALGIYAAGRAGSAQDRIVTLSGLGASVIPEFVAAVLLMLLFAIYVPILPISATAPTEASFSDALRHLILPAIALMAGLFGYILRIVRANALEVYRSDYVRTSALKGISRWQVTRRHVLRNALAPSTIVMATQIGYMLGGLVVIEKLFNYPGIGLLMLRAADASDFPVLEATIMLVGAIYVVLTLFADIVQRLLDPTVNRVGL